MTRGSPIPSHFIAAAFVMLLVMTHALPACNRMGESLSMNSPSRKQTVKALASRLEKLNEKEKKELIACGNEAFKLVYARVQYLFEQRIRMKKGSENKKKFEEQGRGLINGLDVLIKVAAPGNSRDLITLLEARGGLMPDWFYIMDIIMKCEEQDLVELFFRLYEKHHWSLPENRKKMCYEIMHAISKSRDPRVVSFLLDHLRRPDVDSVMASFAYISLAESDGDEGLQAVIEARDKGRTISSIEEFLDLPQALSIKSQQTRLGLFEPELVDTVKDNDGVEWGLMHCGAAGMFYDLWVIRKENGHWKDPLFTGVSCYDIGAIDWFHTWVCNKDIGKDSDCDGLTDLMERRIGTNPYNSDTDGDGLIDSCDRNPLAAPRALSDEEEILYAAFEARFKFEGSPGVPCLVSLPARIEPFEFPEWKWFIIPKRFGTTTLLDHHQWPGSAEVSFGYPKIDFEGHYNHNPQNKEWVLWNNSRTEARLHVTVFYASCVATGFDLHLKKIKGHWVVIDMERMWIS